MKQSHEASGQARIFQNVSTCVLASLHQSPGEFASTGFSPLTLCAIALLLKFRSHANNLFTPKLVHIGRFFKTRVTLLKKVIDSFSIARDEFAFLFCLFIYF